MMITEWIFLLLVCSIETQIDRDINDHAHRMPIFAGFPEVTINLPHHGHPVAAYMNGQFRGDQPYGEAYAAGYGKMNGGYADQSPGNGYPRQNALGPRKDYEGNAAYNYNNNNDDDNDDDDNVAGGDTSIDKPSSSPVHSVQDSKLNGIIHDVQNFIAEAKTKSGQDAIKRILAFQQDVKILVPSDKSSGTSDTDEKKAKKEPDAVTPTPTTDTASNSTATTPAPSQSPEGGDKSKTKRIRRSISDIFDKFGQSHSDRMKRQLTSATRYDPKQRKRLLGQMERRHRAIVSHQKRKGLTLTSSLKAAKPKKNDKNIVGNPTTKLTQRPKMNVSHIDWNKGHIPANPGVGSQKAQPHGPINGHIVGQGTFKGPGTAEGLRGLRRNIPRRARLTDAVQTDEDTKGSEHNANIQPRWHKFDSSSQRNFGARNNAGDRKPRSVNHDN